MCQSIDPTAREAVAFRSGNDACRRSGNAAVGEHKVVGLSFSCVIKLQMSYTTVSTGGDKSLCLNLQYLGQRRIPESITLNIVPTPPPQSEIALQKMADIVRRNPCTDAIDKHRLSMLGPEVCLAPAKLLKVPSTPSAFVCTKQNSSTSICNPKPKVNSVRYKHAYLSHMARFNMANSSSSRSASANARRMRSSAS
jgi:hypothetical protein